MAASQKPDRSRLLIYSHDSFGLGHLRRCRTLAHALVDAYKGLSVLIITGSPIIGQFDFKARVDFVRIPGIIKLRNGDYTSLGLHIDLEDTLALRESIILHTAQVFAPDVFLVDKEPTGLRGEVLSTLKMLQDTPTRCVLGLRDVMDDPDLLRVEWEQKQVAEVLANLYDELWVYGPKLMGNPLEGALDTRLLDKKMVYTGYLERSLPEHVDTTLVDIPDYPYILVTPGGGGDGIEMVDWVLRAYESSVQPCKAVLVLGPFMPLSERDAFIQRGEPLEQVTILTFTPNLELLMQRARAVIAMGGYNTFCEILSFDRPALIVPRSRPRREQLIRARKAEALGLVSVLDPATVETTAEAMTQAIQALLTQSQPSQQTTAPLLNGLKQVALHFANPVIPA